MLSIFLLFGIYLSSITLDRHKRHFEYNFTGNLLSSFSRLKEAECFSCHLNSTSSIVNTFPSSIEKHSSKFAGITEDFAYEIDQNLVKLVQFSASDKLEASTLQSESGNLNSTGSFSSLTFKKEKFFCTVAIFGQNPYLFAFNSQTKKFAVRNFHALKTFEYLKVKYHKGRLWLLTKDAFEVYNVKDECKVRSLHSAIKNHFVQDPQNGKNYAFEDFKFTKVEDQQETTTCAKFLMFKLALTYVSTICFDGETGFRPFNFTLIPKRFGRFRTPVKFFSQPKSFSVGLNRLNVTVNAKRPKLLKIENFGKQKIVSVLTMQSMIYVLIHKGNKGKLSYTTVKVPFPNYTKIQHNRSNFNLFFVTINRKIYLIGRNKEWFVSFNIDIGKNRIDCKITKHSHRFFTCTERFLIKGFNILTGKYEQEEIEVKWKFIKYDLWKGAQIVVVVGGMLVMMFVLNKLKGTRKKVYMKVPIERKRQ